MHAIEVLSEYINESYYLKVIGYSTEADFALTEINRSLPDILFLDISMPRVTGFEFRNLIPSSVKVVFSTAHPDYALKAFENFAYDYLLKPITYSRFQKCVQKLLDLKEFGERFSSEQNEFFFIKCENKGKMIKLNFEDIIYIESNSNYIVINTNTGQYSSYLTLREVEYSLPKHDFIRIHKSFIINVQKIKQIEGNRILLSDKSTVQIGATYREKVFEVFNKYLISTDR